MVHHGYQRPGYGHIVGDCFGVGYLSYNRSIQGCVEYREAVQGQLVHERKVLASIDCGETKEAWVKRRAEFGRSELVKVTADEPKFNEALQTFRGMVVGAIRDCEREIKRMEQLIAAWQLEPLRTTEEASHEKGLQKEARKAAREVKRAAAREKQAALAAKQAARVAEKQALIAKYKAKFEALASGLESTRDRKHQARWDWVEMQKAMRKKGYLAFYEHQLECNEALKILGLAEDRPTPEWGIRRETTPKTYVRYADRDGLLL